MKIKCKGIFKKKEFYLVLILLCLVAVLTSISIPKKNEIKDLSKNDDKLIEEETKSTEISKLSQEKEIQDSNESVEKVIKTENPKSSQEKEIQDNNESVEKVIKTEEPKISKEEEIKKIQEDKEKKMYNVVQDYANECRRKKNINFCEINHTNNTTISGEDYYVYDLVYDTGDGYAHLGDCAVIVNSNTFELSILYNDGQIISKDEMLNPYEDKTLLEINENQSKYSGNRVRVSGIVTSIKETDNAGELVLMDDSGQGVSVHYVGKLSNIINNDSIAVKGIMTSDTIEYYNTSNEKILLPVITSEKDNINKFEQ